MKGSKASDKAVIRVPLYKNFEKHGNGTARPSTSVVNAARYEREGNILENFYDDLALEWERDNVAATTFSRIVRDGKGIFSVSPRPCRPSCYYQHPKRPLCLGETQNGEAVHLESANGASSSNPSLDTRKPPTGD